MIEKSREKFLKELKKIHKFCEANGVQVSFNTESFFFNIKGQNYIVTSNKGDWCGEFGETCIVITASRFRFINIYKDLAAGYLLDPWGRRVENIKNEKDKETIKFCEENDIEYSTPLYSYYFEVGGLSFLVLPEKKSLKQTQKINENGDPTIYFWHDKEKIEKSIIITANKYNIKQIYWRIVNQYEDGVLKSENFNTKISKNKN